MTEGADEKQMKLRYAGACRVCDAELPARIEAIYDDVPSPACSASSRPTGH